jgi:hypothetical protein
MSSSARTATISLLLLAVIGVSIAGCGGGSSTATTAQSATNTSATATGTKSAPRSPAGAPESKFITSADAICRRVNIELAAVKTKSKGLQEIARLTPHNVALESGALAKLSKLEPPASLASDWRRMLGYRRTLADELAKLATSARREDESALKALASSKKRTHASLRELATHDGFKDCAEVGLGKAPVKGNAKPS